MAYLYESEIEEMAIEELQALGYTYISGNDLTPDTAPLERKSFADVILRDRCLSALRRINPHLSDGAIESALKALYQRLQPIISIMLLIKLLPVQFMQRIKTVIKKLE